MTRLGMEWGAGYGNRTRISMERFRYGMGVGGGEYGNRTRISMERFRWSKGLWVDMRVWKVEQVCVGGSGGDGTSVGSRPWVWGCKLLQN